MNRSAIMDGLGDSKVLIHSFSEKRPLLLKERSEKKALDLFHAAAQRVPAYKAFLRAAKIDHTRVKTIQDFAAVPITDSKNYIAAYPVVKRCWDGDLTATQFIATSSGTTGEPKFWPRNTEQDLEALVVHKFLYQEYFNVDDRSTLLLIGYPMGIYISGIATLLPSWLSLLDKKRRMSIMSIGNNKNEMIRAVKNLSHAYQQTILIGHPFFIKDVIETGEREGIVWSKKNLGLMFCSEGFTEDWRDYIAVRAGIKDRSGRIFNTYGSSEMLLMGYETSFSIAIKKMIETKPAFRNAFASNAALPQVFQYHPLFRYIESINKELIFSSASGIPLIRFNLHDQGEVIPFERVKSMATKDTHPFPLVTLWNRSDQTIKFHGVNIYPEHIKAGLMEKRFMRSLTGKFVIRKFLDRGMDQRWEINIELTHGIRVTAALARDARESVVATLRKINLEYLDMSSHIKKDVRPIVKLWPYQDTKYFKPGLKPHYIDHKK